MQEKDLARGVPGIPVATIVASLLGKNSIPTGWLLCDGSTINSSDYPLLTGIIGNTLPNLAGRTLIGTGTPAPGNLKQNDGSTPNFGTTTWAGPGLTGGEYVHQLVTAEMPSHKHTLGNASDSGDTLDNTANWQRKFLQGGVDNTSTTGGDQPHNTMQPYLTVSYIICTGE